MSSSAAPSSFAVSGEVVQPTSAAVSTRHVEFAYLGSKALCSSVEAAAKGEPFDLSASFGFGTLEEMVAALDELPLGLLVADAGLLLQGRGRGVSILWPPVLAVADRRLDVDEQQMLRRMGVAGVLRSTSPTKDVTSVLRRVVDSDGWLRMPLRRMDLANVLQNTASSGEGMLTVACPHARSVAPFGRPNDGVPRCGGGADVGACDGWHGRIYSHRDKLIYAETPTARGIEALAQMLALDEGQAMAHELFLRPNRVNVGMSVTQALIESARFTDDRARQAPAPPELPAPPPTAETRAAPAPPPVPSPVSTRPPVATPAPPPAAPRPPATSAAGTIQGTTAMKMTQDAARAVNEMVASSDALEGAALCDDNGWVKALAGDVDAESLCAVVAMTLTPLGRISDLLGMGRLQNWAVCGSKVALYACRTEHGMCTGVGKPRQNLESPFEAMARAAAGTR
ncbi:MAG: hypothetical protein K0V04_11805 [Deltaproteobacteria bacterium]|nr:hypothetical protein [Deltaproteobacteria bacterium]